MKANPITLLLAGSLALAVSADAAFNLIDDFEGHTLGNNVSTEGSWTEFGTAGGTIVLDPANAGTQVAELTTAANAGYQFNLGANAIADDGSEATIFFRYRTAGSFSVYLTDADSVPGTWWTEDEMGIYNNNLADPSALQGHYNTATATSLNRGEWYNVWIHVQNTTTVSEPFDSGTSERYFIYINGTLLNGTDSNGDNSFDTRAWTANVPDLDTLFIVSNNGTAGGMIDDIYIDNTGLNLVNPVPEPSSLALLVLGGLALFRRRR